VRTKYQVKKPAPDRKSTRFFANDRHSDPTGREFIAQFTLVGHWVIGMEGRFRFFFSPSPLRLFSASSRPLLGFIIYILALDG
jgi:hypothetical protein